MTRQHQFVQPTILISGGGLAGGVNVAAKTAVRAKLPGIETPWVRHLHLDYPNATDTVPSELSQRYGTAQLLDQSEKIDLDADSVRELAQTENYDPAFAPLWKLCPREVIARSLSQQAGQMPAKGRAAGWLALPRYVARIETNLTHLAPAGEVLTGLARVGFRSSDIAKNVHIWIIVGAEGGTGNGICLLASVVAASIAAQMSIPFALHAAVAFGYRPCQDSEAELRTALGEQLVEDLEAAQTPGKRLSVVSYNGREYATATPLFARIVAFEARGRLHADAAAMAVAIGETLAFRSVARAAHDIDLCGAQNVMQRLRQEAAV